MYQNAFELHNLTKRIKLGPFIVNPKGEREEREERERESAAAQEFVRLLDEFCSLATFMEEERIGVCVRGQLSCAGDGMCA